ncbi:hypothetical protein P154DRAFT_570330 [Amniculicola lignicola CBS 123094]|uniref:Uncharacterized protein n=1 Tax=Amniculicola lignicola CBS 123094 TaxID=1392246 RepID=A0A6A5X202_9PLEO|nr:hypothetical protein P154DRAFT_570330 [Amniculicola lignicola CBS 123094]
MADNVLQANGTPSQPFQPDYGRRTVYELRCLMKCRGLPLPMGSALKNDLIAALQQHDIAAQTVAASGAQEAKRAREDDEEGADNGEPSPKAVKLEDYRLLTVTELRTLIRHHGISLGSYRKETMAVALEQWDANEPERTRAAEYERGLDEEARKEKLRAEEQDAQRVRSEELYRFWVAAAVEQNQLKIDLKEMLHSRAYQADPKRKSFLDLPGELRNKIYSLALFSGSDGLSKNKSYLIVYLPDARKFRLEQDHVHKIVHSMCESRGSINPEKVRLTRKQRERNLYVLQLLRQQREHTLYVLRLLGRVNNQIRAEATSLFWNSIDYGITSSCGHRLVKDHPSYFMVVERLMKFIGDSGRQATRSLSPSLVPHLDSTASGYHAFQNTLGYIATCGQLTRLSLFIEASLLLREDRSALEALFLTGDKFHSKGLTGFSTMLKSLSTLKTVAIATPQYVPDTLPELENEGPDLFLSFAFSGIRAVMLWFEIKEYLETEGLSSPEGVLSVYLPTYHLCGAHQDQVEEPNYALWLARGGNEWGKLVEVEISEDESSPHRCSDYTY